MKHTYHVDDVMNLDLYETIEKRGHSEEYYNGIVTCKTEGCNQSKETTTWTQTDTGMRAIFDISDIYDDYRGQ